MSLKDQQCQSIICKFLLNLPKEQLEDTSRLSHQAEKAYYYYLDVILKAKQSNDWKKERQNFFNKLKSYAPSFLKINSTLLSQKLLENRPVCGAIIFNRDNSKVLVIKVMGRLGFPKGKQNQGQTLIDCAIRQVQEQIDINISTKIQSRVRIDFSNHQGKLFFFVARGVSEEERIKIDPRQIDDAFWISVEQLRKEISSNFSERSKIAWALYERDVAGRSNNQQYAPKYFKKCQEIDFKLDRDKLNKVFQQPNIWKSNK